jgi:hypothetical protein
MWSFALNINDLGLLVFGMAEGYGDQSHICLLLLGHIWSGRHQHPWDRPRDVPEDIPSVLTPYGALRAIHGFRGHLSSTLLRLETRICSQAHALTAFHYFTMVSRRRTQDKLHLHRLSMCTWRMRQTRSRTWRICF